MDGKDDNAITGMTIGGIKVHSEDYDDDDYGGDFLQPFYEQDSYLTVAAAEAAAPAGPVIQISSVPTDDEEEEEDYGEEEEEEEEESPGEEEEDGEEEASEESPDEEEIHAKRPAAKEKKVHRASSLLLSRGAVEQRESAALMVARFPPKATPEAITINVYFAAAMSGNLAVMERTRRSRLVCILPAIQYVMAAAAAWPDTELALDLSAMAASAAKACCAREVVPDELTGLPVSPCIQCGSSR